MSTLPTSFVVCLVFVLWFTSLSSNAQEQDVVFYPMQRQEDELATRIRCRVDESRHFKYKSVTELWNDIDGRIFLEADVTLLCLGDDSEGSYGKQALKYSALISNLFIDEKHKSETEPLRRRRRGIGDFFSDAWRKIKKFFTGLFGGNTQETETRTTVFEDRSITVETTPSTTTIAPFSDDGDEEEDYFDSSKHSELYSAPFEFIQMANGSIPEIRFSTNDTDSKVRNFKRHLVDVFATQLSVKPQHEVVVETSVMGEHLSTYNITMGPRSSAYSTPDELDDYSSLADERADTVIVEKMVTEEDILTLAPSPGNAINNKEKMDLMARQTQIFKDGILLSTSGSSSLVLFPNKSNRPRRKRDTMEDQDKDLTLYFRAHSQYEIQFQVRRKRSVDDNYLLARSGDGVSTFLASSRAAESEDNNAKQRIRDLQMSIGNSTKFVQDLVKNIDDYEYDKLQMVFELVDQELRYDLDKEPQSISLEIRRLITEQVVDDLCTTNHKKCFDLLQLLSRAGGLEAEEVLLSVINSKKLSSRRMQEIIDLFSDLSNPSSKIIQNLNDLLRGNRLEPSLIGSLCLGLSNLATKADEEQKAVVAETMIDILEATWSSAENADDELLLDILEAIGNIGHEKSIDPVLAICAANAGRTDIQIACTHALRHMASSLSVQEWMLMRVSAGPCDVIHAVVGSLLDEIYKQELARDEENWPRNHYNEVDAILREGLASSAPEVECTAADVARYFHRKNPSGTEDAFFDTDSEPFEPGTASRQKRDLWGKLNCGEWTEDDKYTPIQEKEEFASDRVTYNKRKSCLATRTLGLRGAKAEIYTGMFAGVKQPSNPPKYKLFSKFVSSVNFLGHDVEIGSFYFYHHTGYTKAYVRIMGKTRQEFRHVGCTPTELRYRPISHVPLYLVRVAVLQFSLGIHLSSELSLDTLCPSEDIYDLKPLAKVRVGGEAMGTVLFARAAINLGGNFNYHLKYTFSPIPDMCLTGQHGYDPMSISMEAYYQLWNAGRFRWGTPRTWKPSSLMWQVNDGRQQQWFNDTCILREEVAATASATPSPAVTEPAPAPPGDEADNVLVVRA